MRRVDKGWRLGWPMITPRYAVVFSAITAEGARYTRPLGTWILRVFWVGFVAGLIVAAVIAASL